MTIAWALNGIRAKEGGAELSEMLVVHKKQVPAGYRVRGNLLVTPLSGRASALA